VSIVIDASFMLALVFEDERTDEITAVGRRLAIDGGVVPGHWRHEIANSILMAVRRKRIDATRPLAIFAQLNQLRIEVDTSSSESIWTSAFVLADRLGLTIYDAAYLELAMRLGRPLASLDKQLRAAARQVGVEILPEAAA
jgi:predicted nucleic acid-binding protein